MSVANPVGVEHNYLFEAVRAEIAAAVEAETPHDTIIATLEAEKLPLDVANLLAPTVPADPEP